jgi:DNA-binding transcriptional regulator LsrR (DeoR family)
VEYLKKIKSDNPNGSDYYTTKQLHKMLGVSIRKVRELLQDADEEGVLDRIWVKKKNIADVETRIPKYRLKDATNTTENSK